MADMQDRSRTPLHSGTVPDVGEETTDYPSRYWRAISRDVAVGYEINALGNQHIVGVVVYRPTSDKLRDLKLRELERMEGDDHWVIRQYAPPTPGQVSDAWIRANVTVPVDASSVEGGRTHPGLDEVQAWTWEEIADLIRPEVLARQTGDSPDDFYRRIARAYSALSDVTGRPVVELAARAGVPVGTAASWVSRARARGFIDEEFDEDGERRR